MEANGNACLLAAVRCDLAALEERLGARVFRAEQLGDQLRVAVSTRLDGQLAEVSTWRHELDRRVAQLSGNLRGVHEEVQLLTQRTSQANTRLAEAQRCSDEAWERQRRARGALKVDSTSGSVVGSSIDADTPWKARLEREMAGARSFMDDLRARASKQEELLAKVGERMKVQDLHIRASRSRDAVQPAHASGSEDGRCEQPVDASAGERAAASPPVWSEIEDALDEAISAGIASVTAAAVSDLHAEVDRLSQRLEDQKGSVTEAVGQLVDAIAEARAQWAQGFAEVQDEWAQTRSQHLDGTLMVASSGDGAVGVAGVSESSEPRLWGTDASPSSSKPLQEPLHATAPSPAGAAAVAPARQPVLADSRCGACWHGLCCAGARARRRPVRGQSRAEGVAMGHGGGHVASVT